MTEEQKQKYIDTMKKKAFAYAESALSDIKNFMPKDEYEEALKDFAQAFIAGAVWYYQQVIKNAILTDVKANKDELFTDESWAETNDLLHKVGAKGGDKVYLSIIKQEEVLH